jgi:hypothetical protein
VVGALSRTGRLVTSGALILALSFLSLSANPDLPVRVIATGLARVLRIADKRVVQEPASA